MPIHIQRTLTFLVLSFVLAACALTPKLLVSGYTPPNKIAVLPMNNQSNDMRGPEYVRQEFVRHLHSRGYEVLPIDATDEILRTKFGITDGGQLNSVTPEKIGSALDVDAVIYGELIDFKFLNVGFYQNRLVEANFKMVETKSGQPLWEDQRRSSKKELQTSLRGAADALAKGVAERAVGNVLNIPLQEQVQSVVRMALSTLPRGR